MTTEEMHEEFFARLSKEQMAYKENLLSQPVEEILDCAREYCMRDDILCLMENAELSEPQVSAMLRNHVTLADLCKVCQDHGSSYMDHLRDVVEAHANSIRREEKKLTSRPVYRYPFEYAQEHGELEEYRLSRRINMSCKIAMEEAINGHYRDNSLNTKAAVQQVVDIYGYERVLYILALTIKHKDWDGRFSAANKQWAQAQPVFEDTSGSWDRNVDLVIDQTHPGLVDMFAKEARHAFLLTQPLSEEDIYAEAIRIMDKLSSCPTPNSPNGTHFMVQVSDDFLYRARGQQTTKLARYFPFQSFTLSRLKDQKGLYALIRKDEDRTKPLREWKTSVRGKLQNAPKKNSPNVSAHSREQEL